MLAGVHVKFQRLSLREEGQVSLDDPGVGHVHLGKLDQPDRNLPVHIYNFVLYFVFSLALCSNS